MGNVWKDKNKEGTFLSTSRVLGGLLIMWDSNSFSYTRVV